MFWLVGQFDVVSAAQHFEQLNSALLYVVFSIPLHSLPFEYNSNVVDVIVTIIYFSSLLYTVRPKKAPDEGATVGKEDMPSSQDGKSSGCHKNYVQEN